MQINSLIYVISSCDAGVITFESVHPRWSYVRLDSENRVTETAEKRPISNSRILKKVMIL